MELLAIMLDGSSRPHRFKESMSTDVATDLVISSPTLSVSGPEWLKVYIAGYLWLLRGNVMG